MNLSRGVITMVQITEILEAAKRAKTSHDSMRRASDTEARHQGGRAGPRGGKRTTLHSKASLASEEHTRAITALENLCERVVAEGIDFHDRKES